MIGVAAIVAQELRIIAAAIDGYADASVVEKISRGKPASRYRTEKVWTERVRRLFKMAVAEIMEHQQRLLVSDQAMIQIHVVNHGAISLHDVRPAVVIVIDKLGGHSAH